MSPPFTVVLSSCVEDAPLLFPIGARELLHHGASICCRCCCVWLAFLKA